MVNIKIIEGECISVLQTLPAESVQCVVTSPPYWGLRDYGIDNQIGLEKSPEEYCENLVRVFREVRRVLKPTGTVWLNLGDSYSSQGGAVQEQTVRKTPNYVNRGQLGDNGIGTSRKPAAGLKPKDLVGTPWRVAFALQADGWYLRSDIIWSKPNPMPESVQDRPTKAHEYIFLLTKNSKYYYDADAIREPMSEATKVRDKNGFSGAFKGQMRGSPNESRWQDGRPIDTPTFYSEQGRNKRSVWEVTTQPYSEAHFATYPEKLIEPCVKAGTTETDTVLDPFSGSGTTGLVAVRLNRSYIGIELNPEYAQMSRERIIGTTGIEKPEQLPEGMVAQGRFF